ncbi:hypothetical protein NADFUDRAFT_66016 [Nadsonia fulvescens var. elongata DSM 6958]|uniref:Zn(2)-C6 fungal-type domain-containing protein n=1 Tax=Nadsonia fulvescens var. elongata DSM 6958 TaxID=857566 RepID=A0A1E3PIW6_9ASCO|nr:hypothetical protein NADFUDRAFT_66016 [Nadsonia fulvescens var. elongata DSM 6958]
MDAANNIGLRENTALNIQPIGNGDHRDDLGQNLQLRVKLESIAQPHLGASTDDMQAQEKKQTRSRNTPRSRQGCITCRKRKKRCDEAKPVCITCRRLGLVCEYPIPGTERKNKQRRRSKQFKPNEINSGGATESASIISEPQNSNIDLDTNINTNLVQDLDVDKTAANQLLGLQHKILSMEEDANPKVSRNSLNNQVSAMRTPLAESVIQMSTAVPVSTLTTSLSNIPVELSQPRAQPRNGNGTTPTCDILLDFDNQVLFPDAATVATSPIPFSSVSSAQLSDVRLLPLARDFDNSISSSLPLSQHNLSIMRMSSPNTQSRLVNMLNEQEFDLSEIGSLHKELIGSPLPYIDSKVSTGGALPELNSPILFPGLTPRTEQLLWGPKTLEDVTDDSKEADIDDDRNQDREIIDTEDNYYLNSPSSSSGSSESSSSSILSTSLTTIGPSRRNRISSLGNIYVHHSTFPSLEFDQFGTYLMDYYQSKLARLVSVSSDEYNHFLSVFLPMSTRNDAVLYSILAWTSFHKGNEYDEIGHAYLQRAKEHINSRLSKAEPETLAALLLLCAAEICRGDMVQWDKHLITAAKIITHNGGISNFLHERSLRWLASNFAYHDVLASSTNERGTYFNTIQYDEVFEQGHGLDPLLGCCQPLFQMLSEISELAVESQRISNNLKYKSRYDIYARSFQNSNQNNNDDNFADDRQYKLIPDMHTFICQITEKALALEEKIHSCIPDTRDVTKLTASDLESQLMLFETFQITAKLHLKQSVLRINPSSLIMQGLADDLTNSLDKVLETPVEGGLCFPLFIVGVNSVSMECRNEIMSRFETFQTRNCARNIRRAIQLLQEVWKLDPDGTKHVDWYGIIKKRGWDISFA